MINFHKYGFLDVKRLKRYLEGNSYWLCGYNPVWLFIWNDLYKPEIAFEGELCFIRYLMPEIGICYYPPIGTGNIAEGLKKIRLDCEEHGYELNMAPFSEDMLYSYTPFGYEPKENEGFQNYIYACEDLAYPKNKRIKSILKKFEHEHKKTVYRKIKKEDFPRILEFIEKRNQQEPSQGNRYFARLNSVKRLMEHLYEFDLLSVMLCDEEQIYGIAMASILENTVFTHLFMTLPDIIGAREELLLCLAKEAMRYARYLNLEEDMCSSEQERFLIGCKPVKLEKFYSTFRL